MLPRPLRSLAPAAVWLAISSTARAQPAPPPDFPPAAPPPPAAAPASPPTAPAPPSGGRADEEFHLGRAALDARAYKIALVHFTESQRLVPGRGKLLNIAICEEALGRIADALAHFQELTPQLADDPERRDIAATHAAALWPRVPRLLIALGRDAPADTRLRLDDAQVVSGVELAVNPGPHVVMASAVGRLDRRFDVTLAERAQTSVVVEPGAVAAREPPAVPAFALAGPPPPPPPPAPPSRAVPFAIGAVGVAGLVGGLATSLATLSTKSQLDRICPTMSTCIRDPSALKTQGIALSVASTALFVVGAAGVATGTGLLLSQRASPAPRAGASLVVGAGAEGGGMVFRGAF